MKKFSDTRLHTGALGRAGLEAEGIAPSIIEAPDIVLVGSGIMSSTLAVMLKRLDPRLRIQMFEVTTELASEASDGWNNAGTGHAGICEMSYTPDRDQEGRVPIARALRIFEQFEQSMQFWGAMVANGMVEDPADFIQAVPHICFVKGADDVAFLQARHAAMMEHHFFRGMRLTMDPSVIHAWVPLVMEGREPGPVAATVGDGTEVNFGLLARRLCGWLAQQEHCGIANGWKVTKLRRGVEGWQLGLRCAATGEVRDQHAKFVFVGAGGGSLPLLQSTGLAEVAGLGGFPIGGQWLVCDEPATCERHEAKVYGATPPSSPSLGSGHLDMRRLNGQRQLLFGPFASWTTRFLKQSGQWSDLPFSLRANNVTSLLRTAFHNGSLVRYLVKQGLQSMESRMQALREYYPNARSEHWRLVQAGIRVQSIKKTDRGALFFGTELFSSADHSLAALLGASPGASVAVNIAFEVIQTCLPHLLASSKGRESMRQMIPTFDIDLKQPGNANSFEKNTREASERLQINSSRAHCVGRNFNFVRRKKMKIVRYQTTTGQTAHGRLHADGRTTRLAGDIFGDLTDTGEAASIAKLLAPIEPRDIICIGLNYRKHAAEGNQPIPEWPVVFMKNSGTLQHPGEPIVLPRHLKSDAVYNNSESNAANPDPGKRVKWGPQTIDEMMIGYVDYFVPLTDNKGAAN